VNLNILFIVLPCFSTSWPSSHMEPYFTLHCPFFKIFILFFSDLSHSHRIHYFERNVLFRIYFWTWCLLWVQLQTVIFRNKRNAANAAADIFSFIKKYSKTPPLYVKSHYITHTDSLTLLHQLNLFILKLREVARNQYHIKNANIIPRLVQSFHNCNFFSWVMASGFQKTHVWTTCLDYFSCLD
jgi:hypothetical protein